MLPLLEIFFVDIAFFQQKWLSMPLLGAFTNFHVIIWKSVKKTFYKFSVFRLGQGDIMSLDGRAPPLRVETLHMHGIRVRAVACGKEHTMAVTQEGKVRKFLEHHSMSQPRCKKNLNDSEKNWSYAVSVLLKSFIWLELEFSLTQSVEFLPSWWDFCLRRICRLHQIFILRERCSPAIADVDGVRRISERMGSYVEESAYCRRSWFIVLPCSLRMWMASL